MAESSVYIWGVLIRCVVDEHHKQTPVFADLPHQLAQLLMRSIAINSAYTSRVLVFTYPPFTSLSFCRLSHHVHALGHFGFRTQLIGRVGLVLYFAVC